MNRRETLQALQLLDECIDHAGNPAVMLAMDALRRELLQLWQQGLCRCMDGAALIALIAPLPDLCRAEMHPALPMRMSQIALGLYSPEVNPAKEPLAQCREHAEKIRSLRRWQERLAELLALYDEEIRREVQQLAVRQMDMMSDVFVQLLTMAQGCMAAEAARHRAERLKEIAVVRDGLCLEDVAQAQTDAETVRMMTQEKFSEFSAEIASAPVLLQVKETQPDAAAYRMMRPEEVSEE